MGMGALHVARTGLDAQNFRMQVIANNLANVNTTGFKRDRANFETLAYQAMLAPGAPSSAQNLYAVGFNLGTGVQMTGTARIDLQGTLSTTGNGLDVAIEGAGFFQIEMPDGRIGYTRAGNFSLSAEGNIVTPDGMPLVPQIQIPDGASAISIAADGTVSASIPGQAEAVELGQIETAIFFAPNGSPRSVDAIRARFASKFSGSSDLAVSATFARYVGRSASASANQLELRSIQPMPQRVSLAFAQDAYRSLQSLERRAR